MRLCRCGAIVKGKCERCDRRPPQEGTTSERGYDNQWRLLSERKRKHDPMCEECTRSGGTRPASEVHHVVPICDAPHLRLVWSNLMSVCGECHKKLEGAARREARHSLGFGHPPGVG
jgi:5-methylcytosine-specific restriction endonuclease McrA